MSCLITMSQKELHRLELIQKIRDGRLSVGQAAELLGLSRSQVLRNVTFSTSSDILTISRAKCLGYRTPRPTLWPIACQLAQALGRQPQRRHRIPPRAGIADRLQIRSNVGSHAIGDLGTDTSGVVAAGFKNPIAICLGQPN
jgi:hypothetical protein